MSAVCTSTAPPKLQLRAFDFYPSGLVQGEEQISLNDDAARHLRNANKPLPYIPQDVSITLNGTGDSRPPVSKTQLQPTLVSPVSPRKVASFSSYYPKSSAKMLETFQTSPLLAALVAHLDWVDAYSLFATCKTFREVLKKLQLRDVVLARFVPGYAHAMKGRNMRKYHHIPISIHDLDLLVISQRLPLHRYPTHALRTLTSLYPTFEDDETTRKLIALSQAHSRFVLLLQSLLHSSSLPIPPEPPADLEPTFKYARSRFSLSPYPSPRELTFPAPLAYAEETIPHRPESTLINLRIHRNNGSSSNSILRQARHHITATNKPNGRSPSATTTARSSLDEGEFGQMNRPKINHHHGPRPSASSTLSSMMSTDNYVEDDDTSKHGRRLSIFSLRSSRTRSKIIPPPPEEPRTLKEFHDTWSRRKTGRQKYYSMDGYDYDYERGRDGEGSLLKRPNRRFASLDQQAASSDSSISSLQGRDSPAGNRTRLSPSSASASNTNTVSSQNTISSTSHHDLTRAATSRLRAPIIRVFVPCTHLDAGGKSVIQCEKQLQRAGLWDHLSTGDVVCNFGYVPMSTEDEGALELGPKSSDTKNGTVRSKYSPTSSGSNTSGQLEGKGKQTATNSMSTSSDAGHRKWLVFNGRGLVPYTPPFLVPISQPLLLPSPFYYKHLVATDNSNSRSSGFGVAFSPNFTFMISRMPPVPQEDILDMRLMKAETKVPSPHSPMGYAIVRRWAWIARVSRTKKANSNNNHLDEMGEGWLGEWVMEYEGTKEGREVLLDALSGRSVGKAVWELVKEKSGDGCIWLRLLP